MVLSGISLLCRSKLNANKKPYPIEAGKARHSSHFAVLLGKKYKLRMIIAVAPVYIVLRIVHTNAAYINRKVFFVADNREIIRL